jgi:hypothetical protein
MTGENFKLPVLARDHLRAERRKHPEITKPLAADAVGGLAKGELLALADKLGIDVKAIIADVQKVPSAVGMEAFYEEEELEQYNHSHEWPALPGEPSSM